MKKRIISSVLLASLILSVTACAKDGGTHDTSADTSAAETDVLPAGIEKQKYNGDVNILMPN